jgi:pyochelin synthetase
VTPHELLAELLARGASLEVRGHRLRVEAPRGVLTPEIRDALAECKSVLLVLLSQHRTPYAFPWPDAVPGYGARLVGPFDLCRCGTGSWVRYGDTPLCLACACGGAPGARAAPAPSVSVRGPVA